MSRKTLVAAFAVTFAAPSAPTTGFADRDPNRPTDKNAADLGISDVTFKEGFAPVRPAKKKVPSGARQYANKDLLLPCLRKENPEITNAKLDAVKDKCRPEGPNGKKSAAENLEARRGAHLAKQALSVTPKRRTNPISEIDQCPFQP